MTINEMLNDKAETLVLCECGGQTREFTVQVLFENGFGHHELTNEENAGPFLKLEQEELDALTA